MVRYPQPVQSNMTAYHHPSYTNTSGWVVQFGVQPSCMRVCADSDFSPAPPVPFPYRYARDRYGWRSASFKRPADQLTVADVFENIEQQLADDRVCMTGPTGGVPRHQGTGVIKMPHGNAPIQISEYRPAVKRPHVSSHSLLNPTTPMLRASTASPSPVPVDSNPGGLAERPRSAVHNAPTPTPTPVPPFPLPFTHPLAWA